MNYTAYRGQRPGGGVGNSLLILLLGVILGVLGRWINHNMALSSEIQILILLGCVLALYSRTALRAALHVFLLLGGVAAAYCTTAVIMGGTWTVQSLLVWGLAAVLAAVPGYLMWYAKGRTRRAWGLCAAVLACQVAVMLLFSGGVRVTDVALIVLTAVALGLDKAGRRMGGR